MPRTQKRLVQEELTLRRRLPLERPTCIIGRFDECADLERLRRSVALVLQDVEHEYIQAVLAANQNNISRTAGILGIDRKTLREKLKRYQPQK